MQDRRGTWPKALASLFGAVLLILTIRWALFEPYVIPSQSMLPTLLVRDHILVNKFAYGLRLPFTSRYLLRFGKPAHGDVVVFRSVEDDDVFVVKRVIAVEGDEVSIAGDGQVAIGGVPIPRRELRDEEANSIFEKWDQASREEVSGRYIVAEETPERGPHFTMTERDHEPVDSKTHVIEPGHVFLMGDNRDHSADSRSWGALPLDRILGRASSIWLSCEESLPESNQLCDPERLRWSRIFTRIP
ncbi:MAG: signal peptidase I [Bdellovibrionota bacterium]